VLRLLRVLQQLHWLYWAYYLEMQGVNTFFPLWMAGLAFFSVNIGILATLMRHHSFTPMFRSGDIVQLVPTVRTKDE
jgi:phosphatidylinositol glycan class M